MARHEEGQKVETEAVRAERERLIARIRELADSREYPNDAQAQGARWVADVLTVEGGRS